MSNSSSPSEQSLFRGYIIRKDIIHQCRTEFELLTHELERFDAFVDIDWRSNRLCEPTFKQPLPPTPVALSTVTLHTPFSPSTHQDHRLPLSHQEHHEEDRKVEPLRIEEISSPFIAPSSPIAAIVESKATIEPSSFGEDKLSEDTAVDIELQTVPEREIQLTPMELLRSIETLMAELSWTEDAIKSRKRVSRSCYHHLMMWQYLRQRKAQLMQQ